MNMRLNSLLLLTATVWALAGCSSTPTKVDSGKIHASTFSFVNRGTRPSPENVDERQSVHMMIQDSITKNLSAKGVTKAASVGDVIVGYLVIIGNNATTESIASYFGYGEDSGALHDKAHSTYTGSKNPNYFEAGTLLIDIVDAKTHKLMKRGYATRSTLKNLAHGDKAAVIQEVVDEILSDLRITH